MIRLYKYWVETCFFGLLAIGFIISIFAPSPAIRYIIIFLSGVMAGRMWWQGKKAIKLPTTLVVIGLVVGYMLGTWFAHWKAILLVFIIGAVATYYLHDKGYIKI